MGQSDYVSKTPGRNNNPMNKKKIISADGVASTAFHSHFLFLLRHGAVWFWGNFFAASLLILLFWLEGDADIALALVWYVVLISLSIVRWSFGQRFLPGQISLPSQAELHAFAQRHLLYSTLISALWGVSGLILFSPQALIQAAHVLLLGSAVVAAMPVLTLSRIALYVQVGTILLPITVNLLLHDEPYQWLLALTILLLGTLLGMVARFVNQLLDDLNAAKLQMQEQAHTDPVTQIPNRRFFDQIFKSEWRRAARDSKSLSLLMVDVDYFKRYNDNHGHHAGDQCLQIIAQCIRASARRPADVVARHGGEEFVVLLPNTSLGDAAGLAEGLRKNIEAQRIPHTDNSIPRIVTVSIGVAACVPVVSGSKPMGDNAVTYPAMLLKAADRALYRAKRNGRNQVAKDVCGQSAVAVPVHQDTTIMTHAM